MRLSKKISLFVMVIVILFFSASAGRIEFPEFRVVLDPGHGGVSMAPRKRHGDRYDSISKKYLSNFVYGVRYRGIDEHIIMHSIALKVKALLELCSPHGDFRSFCEILRRFTDDDPERIIIHTLMSRGDSSDRDKIEKLDDPNANFRLFDFPDKHGEIQPGRISRINAFSPHLVVSLHCDLRAPAYYRGINPVIVAPYSLCSKGLNFMKGIETEADFFYNSPYSDWFIEAVGRTGFEWFLNDISVYFTGFTIDSKCGIEKNNFRGYKNNMVTWSYCDGAEWEKYAAGHPHGTQYASSHKGFVLRGEFWERERSVYEAYRRDGGPEGYGGDNLYAANEIIKYILYSLYLTENHQRSQKPGRPYISIWTIPRLVNAVSAYIELGYLYRKRDRFLLTHKQNEIAEGIAAGVYSLLAGMRPEKCGFKYTPAGKSIDLQKYSMPSGKSYFDAVLP